MSKAQIIAKVMLSCLGIHAILYCASGLVGQNISEPSLLPVLLPLSIFIVLTFLTTYFLIFNNNSLARKITGTTQPPADSFDRKIYLIKAYHLGFTFIALLFLSGIGYWFVSFIIDLPSSCIQIRFFFYNLLRMLVTIYLLCGAPHIIRWHIKHLPPINNSKGSQNE